MTRRSGEAESIARKQSLVDRRHYRVGSRLMNHMTHPWNSAQCALGNIVVKPCRLFVRVDQLVIFASDDSDGHCQGSVVLVQRKGGGDHEGRLGSAGAKL